MNRIVAFLVTVLELPYLPGGIAEGLRYQLYVGVQDQDLSFAILRPWIRLTGAVQFNFEVRRFFGDFLAGHPDLGATTLKQEIFNKNIYGNSLSLYFALKFRAKLGLKTVSISCCE